MSEITYRAYDARNKGETGFILKPWIRYLAAHPVGLLKRPFVQAAKETVQNLIHRSTVIVAEYAHSPGQLFGFVAFEPDKCLHLVYVKELMRGNKIGSDLLGLAREHLPGELQYTCKTKNSTRFLPEAKFNPRLVNK